MAGINSVSIHGIRSFGAEEHDQQIVKFKKPLTLLLGENGCGKTTVLESIKYALCGELPPACNRGQGFLHDPKLARQQELMAQIRLEFTDSRNSKYLVVRSMKNQLKAKTLSFKTVDSTVKTIDHSNKLVEISSRVAETDDTIANILGVSKAVLNYVIFCHQEDSDWPLDEGKKLKEKFDAIFDSTKYNKCFDQIKKLRDKYKVQIDKLEFQIKYLADKRSEYKMKESKIKSEEREVSESEEKLEKYTEELAPIETRLIEINTVFANFAKFKTEKDMADERLKTCMNVQSELKSAITKLYEGSEDELSDEIKTFSLNVKRKEKELEGETVKLKNLQSQDNSISKDISNNEIRKNHCLTIEGQNQDRMDTMKELLTKACDTFELSVPSNLDEKSSNDKTYSLIMKKIKGHSTEIESFKTTSEAENKKFQNLVDCSRNASARHEQKIIGKKQEINEFQKQSVGLEKEIKEAKESKSKIDSLKVKLETAESNLQTVSEEFDDKACQNKINDSETTLNQREEELDDLNTKVDKMQAQQAILQQVDMKKQLLKNKEKTTSRLKNEHSDDMEHLLGNNIPSDNFKVAFLKLQTSLKNEIDQMHKKLKKEQCSVASLEANRSHQKSQLDKYGENLSKAENKMYEHCKSQSLESVLSKLDSKINSLQDEKSELASSEFIVGKYINKLEMKDPCCPLCTRDFDDQEDVVKLVSKLKEKIHNVPKKLESISTELSRKMEERDKLIGLKTLSEEIQALKDEKIPELQSSLKKTEEKLQESRDTIEELEISVADPKSKLSSLESMLSDMTLLDQSISEGNALKKEVALLESKMASGFDDISLDDIKSKQSTIKQEISELKSTIKLQQTNLNKYNLKMQKCRNERNDIKEALLKIQGKVQELCSLETRYDSAVSNKEKCKIELDDLRKTSETLKSELEFAEENKSKASSTSNKKLNELLKKELEYNKLQCNLSDLKKEISLHESKNVSSEIESIRQKLKELKDEKDDVHSKIELLQLKIEEMKDNILNQTIDKRNLEDNVKLKRAIKEETGLREKIANFENKMGDMNYTSLDKENVKLIKSRDRMRTEKAFTAGIIEKLKESIRQVKNELKKAEYRNVNEDYKKAFFKLELIKAVDKDIKEYSLAMDYCLLKYHKDKMKSINTLIRDMWRSIYRGNDIDYIEIQTDESSIKGNSKKRIYNYRVVQCRNDIEIDMRGRCSAGQKVLACLIIRMALAETFSNKFGVLALDEPTTNLDKENVTSLCNALGEMVVSRMKHNNFLFIIITHDEEFLTSLGRVDKLTHYYRVTRNDDGKSRIEKRPML